MTQSTRIKDMPDLERPRERLAAQGAEALSPAELIAILLRTGLRGRSAIEVAHELLREFGDLNALAQADLTELQSIKGIGRDKAVTLKAAFTLARRMARELRHARPQMDQPEVVAEQIIKSLGGHGEWWHVFARPAVALHHLHRSNPHKLVYPAVSGNEHPIPHHHVPAEQRRIGERVAVAHHAVVAHVAVRHEKVPVSDNRIFIQRV